MYILGLDVERTARAVSNVRFEITTNRKKSMHLKRAFDVAFERRQIGRNRNLRSCSGCSKHSNGCWIVFSARHVCCSPLPLGVGNVALLYSPSSRQRTERR